MQDIHLLSHALVTGDLTEIGPSPHARHHAKFPARHSGHSFKGELIPDHPEI